ncbi:RNase H family protein [Peptococcus simiae]|uniref:RNase H family protein n=1 Tax=Peptococcus simiae TaxID=1643805 RepID=A0ABW9GX81_9FIRM
MQGAPSTPSSKELAAATPQPTEDRFVAYVDGSYDARTGRYACGVVMLTVAGRKTFSEAYTDPENAKLHNVAGELAGAYRAMAYALDQGVSELVIVHDYTGIAEWARGSWKANLPLTQDYQQYAQHVQGKLKLRFIKVKGHSGDTYNDYADRLAREALAIKG